MPHLYSIPLPVELNFLAPVVVDDLRRVGSPYDGGYVVPKSAVDATQCLLSFGVAHDWTFEAEFQELNPDVTIQAYDHTVSGRKLGRNALKPLKDLWSTRQTFWPMLKGARLWFAYQRFFRKGAVHYPQRIVADATGPHDADLALVFGRTAAARIFVKCDIEGSEYEIVDSLLSHADRIVGMVVEFHSTIERRAEFVSAVEKLLRSFTLVHIHANNYGVIGQDGLPDVLELTFVKREGAVDRLRRRQLPLPDLDRPSNPDAHEYRFSFQF